MQTLHVQNIEASTFQRVPIPVGMAMCTHAAECYEAAFHSSPCCILARKADQRLMLCIPVLLKCLVFELISDAIQLYMRGMRVSTLLGKFVQSRY